MGITTYVMILFGISIAMFFIGYKPLLFGLLQCPTGAVICDPNQNYGYDVLNNILQSIVSNPAIVGVAGLSILTSVLLGGSFAVMYLIPILILFAVSNFLLLPTDFLLSTAMPMEIKIIILGFMNLMLLLTIITFIRGGE